MLQFEFGRAWNIIPCESTPRAVVYTRLDDVWCFVSAVHTPTRRSSSFPLSLIQRNKWYTQSTDFYLLAINSDDLFFRADFAGYRFFSCQNNQRHTLSVRSSWKAMLVVKSNLHSHSLVKERGRRYRSFLQVVNYWLRVVACASATLFSLSLSLGRSLWRERGNVKRERYKFTDRERESRSRERRKRKENIPKKKEGGKKCLVA